MDETLQFLVLSGTSALLLSSWIVKNRINSASRAGAEAFYWISITLSMTAFLWISLDALGLLPANTTSSWWFRILIYRLWLVIGTAVSCATLLILNSSLTSRIAVASNATPRPIRNLMMPLEGALLPVLRFRRSGSVYATRQNLLGAAPSQDTG